MDSNDDKLSALRRYVTSGDSKNVRIALDSFETRCLRQEILKDNSDLIHQLLQTEDNSETSTDRDRIMILYMLVDAGADVNVSRSVDNSNDIITPLWWAMKWGNVATAQVLLQCGADTSRMYRGKSLWDWVVDRKSDGQTRWCENVEGLENIFLQYGKGLGVAVREMQLESIRVSINYCCRMDITVGDLKLMDLALEMGNDEISKLIARATPYLKLAHHILAQDTDAVRSWYETEKTSSSPLFYFGPYGNVPLIHFAIEYRNLDLVRLLLSKGHRVTARISHGGDNGDMPVLFSALHRDMPLEGIRTMLESLEDCDDKLHRLFWLDSNVLHVALRHQCSVDVLRLLLEFGGSLLLCQRNAANQTARDLAQSMQMPDHVDAIDDIVTQWLVASNEPHHRSHLALHSYDVTNIIENEVVDQSASWHDYKSEYYRLQEQLEDMYSAVMDNDVEKTRRLMYFDGPAIGRHHLPLQCRLAGDGLPLLHIAVLRKSQDLVKIMLEDVDDGYDVNAVRDQFGRSALHYAYASADSAIITRLLINAGCTEAVFDMNGRRPDDYKEMQGTPEMEHLLECLRIQDYSLPLADPLEPSLVSQRRKSQWEGRVEAYRKNKSSFVGCKGTALRNGSHFRHPLNDQPLWCVVL